MSQEDYFDDLINTENTESELLSIDIEIIQWRDGGYGIAGHLMVDSSVDSKSFPTDDNNKVYQTEQLAQLSAQEWYVKNLVDFMPHVAPEKIKPLAFHLGSVILEINSIIRPLLNAFKMTITLKKGLEFQKFTQIDSVDVTHESIEELKAAEKELMKNLIIKNLINV